MVQVSRFKVVQIRSQKPFPAVGGSRLHTNILQFSEQVTGEIVDGCVLVRGPARSLLLPLSSLDYVEVTEEKENREPATPKRRPGRPRKGSQKTS